MCDNGEWVMANDTGRFGVGAVHLGSPNRRQFFQLGAGAAAGWSLAGNAFAQTERPTNPPDKPRGQVIAALSQGADRLPSADCPASRSDQGVWWQVFSLLWYIDPEGNFVSRSGARGPGHREWRPVGRRPDLEDQAAQRREVA
ncbi:hypothetical protein BRDID11002_82290 [Bradyrhizobium diazoefficiens]